MGQENACNWQQMSRVAGPCLRPGGSELTARALEACGLDAGARIADIGCGAGGTLEFLERKGAYRVVGVDPSHSLIDAARSRSGAARLVQGRADALPFGAASFDALFCECVLSIVDDPGVALREFARVLDRGGLLVLSDVYRTDLPEAQESDPDEVRRQGLIVHDELIRFLTRHGFTIQLWEDHKRLLKEFAARMILAGESLPGPWCCCGGRESGPQPKISYFLLVARKTAGVADTCAASAPTAGPQVGKQGPSL